MSENDFYSGYVGQTFERLTIKSVVRNPRPKFVCECSCGGNLTTDVFSVLYSKTQSCGCLKREKIQENGKLNIKSEGKVGQRFKNKAGLEFEIIDYIRSHKVLVRFIESGYEKWSAMKEINKGSIRDWIATPLIEQTIKEKKERKPRPPAVQKGQILSNFFGCQYEVIEILENALCRIRFLDEFGFEKVVTRADAKRGVRNPFRRMVAGVGYAGEGKYNSVSHKQLFTLWNNMLVRCYDEKQLKKGITYVGCSVHEPWHCFQTFAQWCELQPEYVKNKDWCLDKDIIVKGNKVYSPDTCSFVPVCINNLFTLRVNDRGEYPLGVYRNKKSGRLIAQVNIEGRRTTVGRFDSVDEAFAAYKQAKEEVIRNLAEKYKSELNIRAYESLIKWNVEVTD